MRTGIATVSLSGLLAGKLEAIAAAGFDGVEIFDQDLVASPLSPREVAQRCADVGLSIELFQRSWAAGMVDQHLRPPVLQKHLPATTARHEQRS